MKQPIVSRSSDVMSGTAVFHGTRVPVQTLLDYIEAGESIVTREHVFAFLEESEGVLLTLDPDAHAGLEACRFFLRVEAQAQRVAVMIANDPLGLPGGEHSERA
jgi:Protein of unknown function (DUF433)